MLFSVNDDLKNTVMKKSVHLFKNHVCTKHKIKMF